MGRFCKGIKEYLEYDELTILFGKWRLIFMKYNWNYGENDCQNYYEVNNGKGKDYLCVFANKKYPDVWMGMYIKNGSDITLMDKTFNDRQRKKESKNGILRDNILKTVRVVSNKNPEYMMKKVEYAYEHGLLEISK